MLRGMTATALPPAGPSFRLMFDKVAEVTQPA